MEIRIGGPEKAPQERVVREGIWVADNGLATVDVGLRDAWLQVSLFACQYGGVTPECDADLAQMRDLVRDLGYSRIGETRIEDNVVMLELL